MPEPSRKPTFKEYSVQPVCGGCGRRLVAKNEPAMWFTNIPKPASVFGVCCWTQAAYVNIPSVRNAA